ncbi:uracil-DNA glycosylase family protein [Puia sp.]|jgi:uracil-DNA glycosylase|uniref:uracil-DNA glycosylase family protein n=1 Tax=Puia sp. TaxID=2045100 RepID=UPI002F415FCA
MAKTFDTQAEAILHFFRQLKPDFEMGAGISIMNPYKNPATWSVAEKFYHKFYGDDRPRAFIFGINPGRHGAGVTGVPFTDPLRLEEKCGIPNEWKKKAELSSQFVYTMIDGYGGVEAFYGRFYITALSPLGFVRDGKNLNYYDDKQLIKDFEPWMLRCIRRQLATMPTEEVCYCLGEGQNFKYFSKVNQRYGFFKEIIPLPHPRWVMQYRLKRMPEFVDLYLERLSVSDRREPREKQ